MLLKNIETALNKQIRIEAESSQIYLSMACWSEVNGLEGIAKFMYAQSDEERLHMLKFNQVRKRTWRPCPSYRLESAKNDLRNFQRDV